MSKDELKKELEKSFAICDKLMEEYYNIRAKKQALLDKNGWCDFSLPKVLENNHTSQFTKDDAKILIENSNLI